MQKIRVVVAEDSLTVRKHLCEVLERENDIEVVGEAENGARAIELCQQFRPDVLTLDMMMPVMSGLAATEYIMAHFPTPIVIVSSSTNRGELFKTYEALAAGAIDVLDKPRADDSTEQWAQRLVSTIRLVARIKVITHPRAKMPLPVSRAALASPAVSIPGAAEVQLVAIGASTGGPAAIVEILRALPSDFPQPILLVMHIGAPFASSFADWLDGQTSIRVAYARGGEALSTLGGRVTMAPADQHLVVREGKLQLLNGPERNFCRPSVDVLFESVAREYGKKTVACLLTGMGRDGAVGLQKIRHAGGVTIAQDEQTSVVFGMPGEAIRLGAAQRVLPLDAIGSTLASLANGPRP